ncbi:hypothetical protein YGS_C2P0253 [Sphingobium sp. YG1]|jgi:hypothetical protein|uniref:hypothetical protein n=2 Tax=Sphingomonadaceae TaxID=41297 RepID=UPI000DBB1F88|nr:hypothetical protein YGS_C2P0253 [Sphingobium sp. YG1]
MFNRDTIAARMQNKGNAVPSSRYCGDSDGQALPRQEALMTRHSEEDFARAVREIASRPGHSGEVTNYQIAMHLDRSPGGGLYKQLEEWRAGHGTSGSTMISRTPPAAAAMLDKVNDHLLTVANAIARDIAGQEIGDLRELYVRTAVERDQAHEEIERLEQRLADAKARERDLIQEVSTLRFCRADRSAQMLLAAVRLSAGIRTARSRKPVWQGSE